MSDRLLLTGSSETEIEVREMVERFHGYCQARGCHFFLACFDGKGDHYAANGAPRVLGILMTALVEYMAAEMGGIAQGPVQGVALH